MTQEIAVRNSYRLGEWSEVIRQRQESGMTVTAFCEQQGISTKSYYYWLKKLRNTALEAAGTPELVKLEDRSQKFSKRHLQIQCGEFHLDVPAKVDVSAVSAIIRAMITV